MMSKITFFLLISGFIGVTSCQPRQTEYAPVLETGVFKVTILYPGGEDKTFDMDYYENKHMPMVAGFIGQNLIFYEIDKGIAGRTPDDKVPFVAVGYFYINDAAEYNRAIAQNIDTIISDIKNYTNIQPVVLISEIKQVRQLQTN